ncbi:MAG: hypothetical protein HC905_14045 [Bacteroidales bacterium]|nr:hypothetical protein [Bacteroidales bacterium]
MAVLIPIPPDTNSVTDTVILAAYPYYYNQLKQQLKQFKNIIWIYPADIHRDTVANNPKQLNFKIVPDKTTNSSGDNLITIHDNDIPAKNHSQPAFFYLSTPQTITDSVKYEIRKKAYTKFLNGAAGFILVQPVHRSVSHSGYNLYNPVSVYLKQLKTIFDTLSWQNLQSGNINITDTRKNPVACYRHETGFLLNCNIPAFIYKLYN